MKRERDLLIWDFLLLIEVLLLSLKKVRVERSLFLTWEGWSTSMHGLSSCIPCCCSTWLSNKPTWIIFRDWFVSSKGLAVDSFFLLVCNFQKEKVQVHVDERMRVEEVVRQRFLKPLPSCRVVRREKSGLGRGGKRRLKLCHPLLRVSHDVWRIMVSIVRDLKSVYGNRHLSLNVADLVLWEHLRCRSTCVGGRWLLAMLHTCVLLGGEVALTSFEGLGVIGGICSCGRLEKPLCGFVPLELDHVFQTTVLGLRSCFNRALERGFVKCNILTFWSSIATFSWSCTVEFLWLALENRLGFLGFGSFVGQLSILSVVNRVREKLFLKDSRLIVCLSKSRVIRVQHTS